MSRLLHPFLLTASVVVHLRASSGGSFPEENPLPPGHHSSQSHVLESGTNIHFIQQVLCHEERETVSICTQTGIEQLKALHAKTHLAGSGDKSPETR